MRLGMFARATFRGQTTEMHTLVPASAVLQMHDRDFVFVPAPDNKFRRVEVVSGDVLPNNTSLQEIKSGLKPGQQVVTNALVLDHVLAQYGLDSISGLTSYDGNSRAAAVRSDDKPDRTGNDSRSRRLCTEQ